ncbi:MAG: response regulator transcription factor [Anaerolineae bacterium]|nr:response regulator transcription factor [Anaerolineae bacterium]
MEGKKILVIDDDPRLQRLLEYTLCQEGAEVLLASDGEEGLRKFYTHTPDLVVLDLMMPRMDGWETAKRIRLVSDVPILMLTARGREEDIIKGFEHGADEYVAKPFSLRVLMARARALLRRASLPPIADHPVTYSDDYLTVDLDKNRVTAGDRLVRLTATEYRLLAYMVENAGRVLSTRQILEKVWGWEYTDDVDYVRIYIWHLRQKLEPDPKRPRYLQTEHGIGYRFVARPASGGSGP